MCIEIITRSVFSKLPTALTLNIGNGLFYLPPPPPPTSLKHEFYGLTSGFTRLIMKIKYVCHGLVSLHVNFYDNRTKWTLTSIIKICRWGGEEKEPGNATIKNQRPMRNFSSERDDLSIVVIISLLKNSQEPMKSWFHNI